MPARPKKKLSPSLEDYLESIYRLCVEKGEARVKDVAQRLGVHKSSVTGALRALSERGLIQYAPYSAAGLTAKGKRRAEAIWQRHTALRNFLESVLDVETEEAAKTACEMEHVVSREMTERLARFAHYLERRPDVVVDFRAHAHDADDTQSQGGPDAGDRARLAKTGQPGHPAEAH